MSYHIVVCGGIAPDPLQNLEPVCGPSCPALKNESLLPAVLDPWAAHALYEAAHLAAGAPGTRVWLVSLAPKAKLQQVLMTIAQKAAFELVALDGPASAFADPVAVSGALADAIQSIAAIEPERLLLFGGWESATRGAGATMQMLGERLGIRDQFQGVDALVPQDDGSLQILERIEGGVHQVSVCAGPPAVIGWATGTLGEPRNNPQVGMANMRGILPALQKARAPELHGCPPQFVSVKLPAQQRATKIVKDLAPEEIAREIAAWITGA